MYSFILISKKKYRKGIKMPLPPALAARLAKRGLIKQGEIDDKKGEYFT